MKKPSLNKKKIIRLGWPFVILLCLTFIIARERIGVQQNAFLTKEEEAFAERLYTVPDEAFSEAVTTETECLVINYSNDIQSTAIWKDLELVLKDMCVAYEAVDLVAEPLPKLWDYQKVILNIADLSYLGEEILSVCDWVKAGGALMSTGTFHNDEYKPCQNIYLYN